MWSLCLPSNHMHDDCPDVCKPFSYMYRLYPQRTGWRGFGPSRKSENLYSGEHDLIPERYLMNTIPGAVVHDNEKVSNGHCGFCLRV